jgi:hypothetical protein
MLFAFPQELDLRGVVQPQVGHVNQGRFSNSPTA